MVKVSTRNGISGGYYFSLGFIPIAITITFFLGVWAICLDNNTPGRISDSMYTIQWLLFQVKLFSVDKTTYMIVNPAHNPSFNTYKQPTTARLFKLFSLKCFFDEVQRHNPAIAAGLT